MSSRQQRCFGITSGLLLHDRPNRLGAALLVCLLASAFGVAGCTGSAGSPASVPNTPPDTAAVSVTVSPTSANVQTGSAQQFSATVIGASNTGVTWSATGGTISTSGLFSAGATAGAFTVTATSTANTAKSAQASVTLSAPAAPAPAAPAGTASSITKDGITWTFSEPVPVGQFVNGDYFVVGPVTITAIDPPTTTSTP